MTGGRSGFYSRERGRDALFVKLVTNGNVPWHIALVVARVMTLPSRRSLSAGASLRDTDDALIRLLAAASADASATAMTTTPSLPPLFLKYDADEKSVRVTMARFLAAAAAVERMPPRISAAAAAAAAVTSTSTTPPPQPPRFPVLPFVLQSWCSALFAAFLKPCDMEYYYYYYYHHHRHQSSTAPMKVPPDPMTPSPSVWWGLVDKLDKRNEQKSPESRPVALYVFKNDRSHELFADCYENNQVLFLESSADERIPPDLSKDASQRHRRSRSRTGDGAALHYYDFLLVGCVQQQRQQTADVEFVPLCNRVGEARLFVYAPSEYLAIRLTLLPKWVRDAWSSSSPPKAVALAAAALAETVNKEPPLTTTKAEAYLKVGVLRPRLLRHAAAAPWDKDALRTLKKAAAAIRDAEAERVFEAALAKVPQWPPCITYIAWENDSCYIDCLFMCLIMGNKWRVTRMTTNGLFEFPRVLTALITKLRTEPVGSVDCSEMRSLLHGEVFEKEWDVKMTIVQLNTFLPPGDRIEMFPEYEEHDERRGIHFQSSPPAHLEDVDVFWGAGYIETVFDKNRRSVSSGEYHDVFQEQVKRREVYGIIVFVNGNHFMCYYKCEETASWFYYNGRDRQRAKNGFDIAAFERGEIQDLSVLRELGVFENARTHYYSDGIQSQQPHVAYVFVKRSEAPY